MSVSTLAPESVDVRRESIKSRFDRASVSMASYASTAPSRVAESIHTRIDKGLVRFDAWFLVFVAVILALGATLLIGMAIYCVTKQGGKSFSGAWSFKNFGLKVRFECV
ncbi:hypothetical protein JNUCC64_16190 [Streptomyces sp. JNUCC 64]